jgi:hypothetical protein
MGKMNLYPEVLILNLMTSRQVEEMLLQQPLLPPLRKPIRSALGKHLKPKNPQVRNSFRLLT